MNDRCTICLSSHTTLVRSRAHHIATAPKSYFSRGKNITSSAQWNRCLDCDSFFQTPLISIDELFKKYQSTRHQVTRESQAAAESFCAVLEQTQIVFKSFIDIGPGDGSLLHLLHKKYPQMQLTGLGPELRPNDFPPQIAWHHVDLSIAEQYFLHSAEMIFFGTSLEHLPELQTFISNIKKMQRSQEHVAIVYHEAWAWPQKIFGWRSPVWDHQHFYVFSQKGLRILMQQNGYLLHSSQKVINKYLISYYLRLLPGNFFHNISEWIRNTKFDFVLPLYLGNRAMVFVRQ